MAVYHDTNFDGLEVGSELINLAEAQRYISNNYQALKKRLENALGYLPQWKKDMQERGIEFAQPEINENWRPIPYVVDRIRTMPSGYQQIELSRQKDQYARVERLHLTTGDLDGAFTMATFDEFLNEKLQDTVDLIKKRMEDETKAEQQEQAAKDAEELKRAQAVIREHKELPKMVREAVELDPYQMAAVSNAVKVVKRLAPSVNAR